MYTYIYIYIILYICYDIYICIYIYIDIYQDCQCEVGAFVCSCFHGYVLADMFLLHCVLEL